MIPWAIAPQDPLSMGFPKQEYWGALPFPSPGDLLYPGTEPGSPPLEGRCFTTEPPGNSPVGNRIVVIPLVILAGEN